MAQGKKSHRRKWLYAGSIAALVIAGSVSALWYARKYFKGYRDKPRARIERVFKDPVQVVIVDAWYRPAEETWAALERMRRESEAEYASIPVTSKIAAYRRVGEVFFWEGDYPRALRSWIEARSLGGENRHNVDLAVIIYLASLAKDPAVVRGLRQKEEDVHWKRLMDVAEAFAEGHDEEVLAIAKDRPLIVECSPEIALARTWETILAARAAERLKRYDEAYEILEKNPPFSGQTPVLGREQMFWHVMIWWAGIAEKSHRYDVALEVAQGVVQSFFRGSWCPHRKSLQGWR